MSEEPPLREPDLPRTMKVRKQALRTGWTTGTCSAAAAKAATLALSTGATPPQIDTPLPTGDRMTMPIESYDVQADHVTAAVIKDAGDDPDVTHGARITVTVSWQRVAGVELDGGIGVGVVTKPGLGLAVGGPAINPTPRVQITQAVGEAVDLADRGVRVVISVPDGERLARKTTNGRLGILGGLSILGTTGIVRPFSTASWRASVMQAVDVLAAEGAQADGKGTEGKEADGKKTLVLATGGRTEKAAMALFPDLPIGYFVEVGDFTGAALHRAVAGGLERVVFVGMVGKLTKLAAGILMTHYTRSAVDKDLLAGLTRDAGGDAELVAAVEEANTARHAYELWESAGLLPAAGQILCVRVRDVLRRFTDDALQASVVLVDPHGTAVIASSEPA